MVPNPGVRGKIPFFFLCVALSHLTASVRAAEKVSLRERVDPGRVVRGTHEMQADGTFFLDPPADAAKSGKTDNLKPETLKISAKTKLVAQDRWRLGDPGGTAAPNSLTTLRFVESAETEVGGEIRPAITKVRGERRRVIVDLEDELPRSVSIDGPLTRSELEALTAPADASSLWTLLPKREVEKGERYELDRIAARCLSLYDSLATNALVGEVRELTEESVLIVISGEVRGAVLGAEGVMKIKGELRFDRNTGLVTSLTIERKENRRPGAVEAGLDIESRITIRREVVKDVTTELAGDPKNWPGSVTSAMAKLEWYDPTSTIRLEHDRDWHVTWTDTEESVLKRVDRGGAVIAQCNVKRAPRVAAGHHQDTAQFLQDVREALGGQFRQVFGEGELTRPPGQGYGYKLAVQGVVQDLPVVWYYYLFASPQGDQYVATVTTTQAETEGGGKPGLALAESLRWSDRAAKKEEPSR